MRKVIQLISIFLYNRNMPPFMKVHVHWVNFDEKPNHTKISKFWNFKRKGCKAKDSFFWPFGKNIMFNGFKMSSFRCKSYVKEIILLKNIFGCLLKLILGIFLDFLHFWQQTKILIHNYICMWNITIVTWIILNWITQFFSLKFVSSKCYLQK